MGPSMSGSIRCFSSPDFSIYQTQSHKPRLTWFEMLYHVSYGMLCFECFRQLSIFISLCANTVGENTNHVGASCQGKRWFALLHKWICLYPIQQGWLRQWIWSNLSLAGGNTWRLMQEYVAFGGYSVAFHELIKYRWEDLPLIANHEILYN